MAKLGNMNITIDFTRPSGSDWNFYNIVFKLSSDSTMSSIAAYVGSSQSSANTRAFQITRVNRGNSSTVVMDGRKDFCATIISTTDYKLLGSISGNVSDSANPTITYMTLAGTFNIVTQTPNFNMELYDTPEVSSQMYLPN